MTEFYHHFKILVKVQFLPLTTWHPSYGAKTEKDGFFQITSSNTFKHFS